MCLNRSLVFNKFTGRSLYRPCGKCEACRQQKAEKQASRIRSHHPEGFVPLFIHLTYLNECCPYILKSELMKHPSYANVYRDYDRRYVPEGKHQVLKYFRMTEPLGQVEFLDKEGYTTLSADKIFNAPTLTPTLHPRPTTLPTDDKIGVIWYNDVQNFFKKFKINMKRLFNFSEKYDYKIHFYSCSEYGEERYRPHFHLLVWCKRKDIKKFERAVLKSWTFAYYYITKRRLEIAIDAASYVASYINKSASFPPIFEEHSIKQKHSFSQGFGCALDSFSLDKVLESVRRGQLVYNRRLTIEGHPASMSFVYPKYVISRYFPKFKGYMRLSNGSLHWIFNNDTQLQSDSLEGIRNEISEKLKIACREIDSLILFKEDIHDIVVSLTNKALLCGYSTMRDYIHAFTSVWNCYASTLYRYSLEPLSVSEQWQYYDNIGDYLEGSVSSISLDQLMFNMPKDFHYETDLNKFYDNVREHSRLERKYFDRLVQRSVNEAANVEFNSDL